MLDSCQLKGWTNTSHLPREKFTELLAAEHLVVTCKKLIQIRHDQSSLRTFREFKVRQVFVEGWTSLINSWILKSQKTQDSNKVRGIAWPAWTSQGLQSTQGSCSISAIKTIDLFHIKTTHIEKYFCSVKQSLPLVKKAQSLAMLVTWLAILTKPNPLPRLWSWVWSTRTFRSSFCRSSHEVICSDTTTAPNCLSLTTWAWLPQLLSLTTWAWLPQLLSLTTLTTWAWLPWLLEPDYWACWFFWRDEDWIPLICRHTACSWWPGCKL